MEADGEILFSSFLAGALLKNKTVTYVDLVNYMSLFENVTNHRIIDDGLYKLFDITTKSDTVISLNADYDDFYDNIRTIRDYLYSMTDSQVRNFFEIEDIELKNQDNYIVKKQGILKKIRTKVFHLL